MGNIDYNRLSDDIMKYILGRQKVLNFEIASEFNLEHQETNSVLDNLKRKNLITYLIDYQNKLEPMFSVGLTIEGIAFINMGGFKAEELQRLKNAKFEKFKRRKEYITFWISIGAIVISLISLSIAIYNFTHKK